MQVNMDVKYAALLAEAYEKFHDAVIEIAAQHQADWPVCSNPEERHTQFLNFMGQHSSHGDEWAVYYQKISGHIEGLLQSQKPRNRAVKQP